MARGSESDGFQRRKGIISVVINLVVPVMIYTLLHRLVHNDTISLALSDAVPVLRTGVLWLRHRRVDWIGLLVSIFFAVSLALSVLIGGNVLSLKLYHPIITGTVGLTCLSSVLFGRPVLLYIFKFIKRNQVNQLVSNDGLRRMTVSTVIIGLLLLGDAVLHVVAALTLSTGTFVVVSRLTTFAIIALLIGFRWLFRGNKP